MKAKFLAITALILGMVSCQKDQAGLDVIVDGEQETTISVSLPETTRANSALGAVDNGVLNDYDIRYILEIYDGENRIKRMVDVKDNSTSTAFDVRLIPGYPYTFVAWADFVEQGSAAYDVNDEEQDIDLYYETTGGLKAVTAILDNGKWVAMTEARDAYTGKHYEDSYSSASNITLELKRPFAKLRVVTTDVEDLKNLGNVTTTKVSVDYRTKVYTGFNALTAEPNTAEDLGAFEYVPNVYTETNQTDLTLLADYLFGTENGTIQFELTAKFSNGKETSTNFNTDIPLYRNKVTTITGNILTDGNDIKVDVGDDFENPNDPNYEFKTISSDEEFLEALETAGKYIVISDLHIAKAGDTVNTLSASAPTGKTVLINLNGKTITVDNKSNSAVVTLAAGDALIFSGEGTIESTGTGSGKLVDGGTVFVTGTADVADAAADVVADVDALKYVLANGGEFTFAKDLEIAEKLTVEKNVVINGNGKTLTYTGADRAIDCPNSNTNVTINDLTVVCTASYCQRGINFNNAGTLTLNKVNVSGTNVTYALNLPGSSDNCTVNINDSSLSGNIALNVWGENSTINTNNTIFTSVDNSTAEGYAAVKLNNDGATSAENSVINIVGGKIIAKDENDELSTAVSNATVNGVVNISESTEVIGNIIETVAVTVYEGYDQFYSFTTLQDAVDKVQKDNNGTIRLIKDVKLTESVTVATDDFAVVLDLNGKTITGTDSSTASFGLITNKGNLTITGNGKMTLKAENNREWNAYSSVISNNPGGKLVVENGTIEHLGGTDMAYGIDNLTNGKGTYAETVINGGTIKSTYRAVRMFLNGIEAQNLLTVNGGIIEGANKSIWMQDPSANANTGKLVVTADAKLKGDAYLSVTAGSTEWPVEISIADDAFEGESTLLYNNNVPEGYEVVKKDGIWTVNAYTVVATAEELTEALANGDDVSLSQDVEAESATTAPYGNKYAFKLDGGVINGNGHKLYMECYGDDYGIMTSGGTIKNLTITEGCRAVMIMYPQKDVILDNVNIGGNGVLYPINTGEAGAEGVNLIVTNSTIAGWTSYGLIESATFTNVEFKQGTYYNNIYGRVFKPYVNTTLTDCTFIEHMNLDLSSLTAGHKIVMKNCKVNGQAVTASVFTIPTTDAQYDTELFTIDLPSWASSINDCVVFE